MFTYWNTGKSININFSTYNLQGTNLLMLKVNEIRGGRAKNMHGNKNGGVIGVRRFGVLEILPDHLLKSGENGIVNLRLTFQIVAHLPLQLIDLPQDEHKGSEGDGWV
jgi:hypothetical protein